MVHYAVTVFNEEFQADLDSFFLKGRQFAHTGAVCSIPRLQCGSSFLANNLLLKPHR
jgi:hypothetical protein